MKLYLTLDNEKGNKIERVIQVDENEEYFMELNRIGDEMCDSMYSIEETEIKDEANRLIANDKANS